MTGPIGFLGLGVMGAAMATRLIQAGHEVTVFNRTRARAQSLARLGAQVADSPRELAGRCAQVFGCLLDTAAVESVYTGRDGALAAARPGQIFVEHATFAPESARRLADAAAERGAYFLDAPVTGGPDGAAAGTLVAMIGGDPDGVHRVRDVLGAYVDQALHVGPVGAGLQLKLVNQLLVTTHMAAAAEAAVMIDRLGLPKELSVRVLTSGWAASAMLTRVLPPALDGDYAGRGATVGGLIEVQRLVGDLAERADTPLAVFPAAREVFARAEAAGLGGGGAAGLVEVYGTEARA
jgi:3-hydroxyisobutyrate dehydrogenase-like beta-hydroxyacid dehydrogenase